MDYAQVTSFNAGVGISMDGIRLRTGFAWTLLLFCCSCTFSSETSAIFDVLECLICF